ncbi:MAG: endolytic transglycosylase MltG [Myxococcota bacterium]|jgi:UPF0755 protein|nr:endolytic transglycosylase MltG [Myxococcota bacterium]
MFDLLKKILIFTLFIGITLAGISYTQFEIYINKPHGPKKTLHFKIAKGQTLKPVLAQIEKLGAIEHPEVLYLYARTQKMGALQHGDYEFKSPQTPLEILKLLERGAIKLEQFTIPEGLNRWQIRDILVGEGWLKAKTFKELCDNKGFLKQAGIPGPNCEGYLFPETYTFARGVSAKKIFNTMFALYKKTYAETQKGHNPPMSFNQLQLTTLASIVEKETGASGERKRIACVFYNRMQAKPTWRLETDPTVIYAATLAEPGFDGNLKRRHLRELKHPYNTYLNKGLPPGPIASPGKKALEAVFEPEVCPYYFFVSKNNGAHQFCETLDCHNANVKKWQIDYFQKPAKKLKPKKLRKKNILPK